MCGLLNVRFTQGVVVVKEAIVDQAAIFAAGVGRAANLPPVPYQIYVSFVVAAGGYQLCHYGVGLLVRAFIRQETQSPSYPEDVNVDREDRTITSEKQSTRGSFWPDALEAHQELNGFIKGARAQKRQIERPSLLVDLVQQVLDSRRFLARQASNSNCGFERRRPGPSSHFPGREAGFEI